MIDVFRRTKFLGEYLCRFVPRRLRSWRRGGAVLLGGAVVLAVLGWQEPDQAGTSLAAAPDPIEFLPVTTIKVHRQENYQVEERHAGVIAAQRLSSLGFARGGLLSTVEVNEGDRVVEGQLLARLDTRSLETRAAELRSGLAESRSRLEVASVNREQMVSDEFRSGVLAKKDWVSKKAHDDTVFGRRKAVAERAAAENAVRHVEATLASLQVDLDQSVLIAPYAGTIVTRRVDEGAAVTAGEPVMDLIESDVVEFRVGVPEKIAATLRVGTNYVAVVGDQKTSCKLLRLLPQVEPSTRTVSAIFSLPEVSSPPLSGMLGHLLTSRTIDTPGFWLPLAALTDSRRGLWAAYVVEPGAAAAAAGSPLVGILSRRDVQLVHVDGDRAFVTGVLRDGEQVVADGVHRLVPGLRVQAGEGGPAQLGTNSGSRGNR